LATSGDLNLAIDSVGSRKAPS